MAAALTLDGIGVEFAGFRAVSGVSTIVEDGELRVLLGANGAGKTTLMDLISGATRCTEGRVFLFDRDITNRDQHVIARAGLGRKFQIPSVFKELSVRRNLEVASCPGRGVFANLRFGFPSRAALVCWKCCTWSGWTTWRMRRPPTCRMGKHNGSNLGCSSYRTRKCCCWTSRPPA